MNTADLKRELKDILECEMADITSAKTTRKGLVLKYDDGAVFQIKITRVDADDDDEEEEEVEEDDLDDDDLDEDDEDEEEEEQDEVVKPQAKKAARK